MANPGPASSGFGTLVPVIANIEKYAVLSITLTPAAVGATTSAEQTFTVTGAGILAGDFVTVNKPTTQVGLSIGNARATGTDAFAIEYVNVSTATITPTANETYLVKVERPLQLGSTAQTITAFPY